MNLRISNLPFDKNKFLNSLKARSTIKNIKKLNSRTRLSKEDIRKEVFTYQDHIRKGTNSINYTLSHGDSKNSSEILRFGLEITDNGFTIILKPKLQALLENNQLVFALNDSNFLPAKNNKTNPLPYLRIGQFKNGTYQLPIDKKVCVAFPEARGLSIEEAKKQGLLLFHIERTDAGYNIPENIEISTFNHEGYNFQQKIISSQGIDQTSELFLPKSKPVDFAGADSSQSLAPKVLPKSWTPPRTTLRGLLDKYLKHGSIRIEPKDICKSPHTGLETALIPGTDYKLILKRPDFLKKLVCEMEQGRVLVPLSLGDRSIFLSDSSSDKEPKLFRLTQLGKIVCLTPQLMILQAPTSLKGDQLGLVYADEKGVIQNIRPFPVSYSQSYSLSDNKYINLPEFIKRFITELGFDESYVQRFSDAIAPIIVTRDVDNSLSILTNNQEFNYAPLQLNLDFKASRQKCLIEDKPEFDCKISLGNRKQVFLTLFGSKVALPLLMLTRDGDMLNITLSANVFKVFLQNNLPFRPRRSGNIDVKSNPEVSGKSQLDSTLTFSLEELELLSSSTGGGSDYFFTEDLSAYPFGKESNPSPDPSTQ